MRTGSITVPPLADLAKSLVDDMSSARTGRMMLTKSWLRALERRVRSRLFSSRFPPSFRRSLARRGRCIEGLEDRTLLSTLTAGAFTPPVATEGQAFSNVTVFHFTDADPNGTASDY